MRQRKFDLSKLLSSGLLASNPEGIDGTGFLELVNIKPWDGKLRYVDRFEDIPASSIMQTFEIGNETWGCDAEGCYKYQDGGFVKVQALVSSKHWNFADFVKFGILSDGDNTVYISNGVSTLVRLFSSELPSSSSMCHTDGGQLILGGLTEDFHGLDGSYVAWSKIGQVNFDLDKMQESGFHNPGVGNILSVQRLGKGFVAIGEKGSGLYEPYGVSFRFTALSEVRGRDKASCASSGDGVFVIDKENKLWRITGTPTKVLTSGKGPELLDYSWVFAGKDIKLFWSARFNELWIQNSNGNYVLNQFGLYQISLEVSGLVETDANAKRVVVSGTDTTAYFRTPKMDFGIGGDKTLTEVYCYDDSVGTKQAQTRIYKGSSTYDTRQYLENDNGISRPVATASVLSVKRTCANFTAGAITNLQIQTTRVDGRSGMGWTGANNAD